MTADPYTTLEDWVQGFIYAAHDADLAPQTCAAEAYGDQWDRMDAYLAEGLPWPRTPLVWDRTLDVAVTVNAITGRRIPDGAMMFGHGHRAQNRERAQRAAALVWPT